MSKKNKISYYIKTNGNGTDKKDYKIVKNFEEACKLGSVHNSKVYEGEETYMLEKLMEAETFQEFIAEWFEIDDTSYKWTRDMKEKWKSLMKEFVSEFKHDQDQYITDYTELVYDPTEVD